MNLAPLMPPLVLKNEPKAHTSEDGDRGAQRGLGEAGPNYRKFFPMTNELMLCGMLNSIAMRNLRMSLRSPCAGKNCPLVSRDAGGREDLRGTHSKLGEALMTARWEQIYSNQPLMTPPPCSVRCWGWER